MEEQEIFQEDKAAKFLKNFFASQGITLRKLSKEDLREEIVCYLRENNILTLATCRDNMPRATAVEYRNDGLTIYIGSEGGGKYANLAVNKNISFTITSPYTTFFSCRGLQGWGKVEIFGEGTEGFDEGVRVLKPERSMTELGMKGMPKVFNRRIIKVHPDRFKYMHIMKGIVNTTYVP